MYRMLACLMAKASSNSPLGPVPCYSPTVWFHAVVFIVRNCLVVELIASVFIMKLYLLAKRAYRRLISCEL